MNDLEQHDSWTYLFLKGKRVSIPSDPADSQKILDEYDGPIITRNITMQLVPYFTPECWERHGYKISDIELTMRQVCSRHLWPVALLYRIALDSSAVKAAFSSETGMVWGAKLAAIRQNINHIAAHNSNVLRTNNPDADKHAILWHKYKDKEPQHKPYIPLHPCTDTQYNEYRACIPSGIQYDLTPVPRIFQWKDIDVVPMRVEQKDLILMTRVVPESVYYQKHGRPYAPVHIPPTVCLPTGERFCLLRESFFLIAQSLYPRYLNAMLQFQAARKEMLAGKTSRAR